MHPGKVGTRPVGRVEEPRRHRAAVHVDRGPGRVLLLESCHQRAKGLAVERELPCSEGAESGEQQQRGGGQGEGRPPPPYAQLFADRPEPCRQEQRHGGHREQHETGRDRIAAHHRCDDREREWHEQHRHNRAAVPAEEFKASHHGRQNQQEARLHPPPAAFGEKPVLQAAADGVVDLGVEFRERRTQEVRHPVALHVRVFHGRPVEHQVQGPEHRRPERPAGDQPHPPLGCLPYPGIEGETDPHAGQHERRRRGRKGRQGSHRQQAQPSVTRRGALPDPQGQQQQQHRPHGVEAVRFQLVRVVDQHRRERRDQDRERCRPRGEQA